MTAASIISIGNPGAGKSTVLNSLAGELLFKSGISMGSGLTYQLDEKKNRRGRFYDTPGLADDTHREAAGKAISTVLKTGGNFKVLFFVRQESGRVVHEDTTTLQLVLNAAPEIQNNYGIVINKLPNSVANLLQVPQQADKFLSKVFTGIPEESRCHKSQVTYLPLVPRAKDKENILLASIELKTIQGSNFEDFVSGQIPIVKLTVGRANIIATYEFDKMKKVIEAMEREREATREKAIQQQRMLEQHLKRVERERREQQERDRKIFNRQKQMMQQKIDEKERELAGSWSYRVSSSGEAANIQSNLMGVYSPTGRTVNGFPVWRNGGQYLYVDRYGLWCIGREAGGTSCGIQKKIINPTPTYPPRNNWRYTKGSGWLEDSTLTIQRC